jgi:hypothetical protein
MLIACSYREHPQKLERMKKQVECNRKNLKRERIERKKVRRGKGRGRRSEQ